MSLFMTVWIKSLYLTPVNEEEIIRIVNSWQSKASTVYENMHRTKKNCRLY